MTPVQTNAASWLDPMVVAFVEAPPQRRMFRPFRQHVDLKLVAAAETGTTEVDPALYDVAGQATRTSVRPGQLLNVRA